LTADDTETKIPARKAGNSFVTNGERMPNPQTLAQRVSSSFTQLTQAASSLNSVSDELGKSVAQIDFSLKNLNLGITVWVKIQDWEGGEEEDHEWWLEQVGYAKIGGKWGISIKRAEGTHRYPERDRVEEWLFNDAPRAMRLIAIDKIPELLDQMSSQAVVATQKIKQKLADVQAVADAVNPPKVARTPIARVPFKDQPVASFAVEQKK
jgi:hypothetical protein